MRTQGLLRTILTCSLVLAFSLQSWPMAPQIVVPTAASALRTVATLPGQSATLLPSGNWLLLGGQDTTGPLATASMSNPSGTVTKLRDRLSYARAWHTATVLPNGTVLILGGAGRAGRIVEQAELFDPSTQTFKPIASSLLPRASHAASLLTAGKLLVAGGVGRDGTLLTTAELWDYRTGETTTLKGGLSSGRRGDQASLLADGTVVFWGGNDEQGNVLTYAELYDPVLSRFQATTTTESFRTDFNVPSLEASVPEDGAVNVPLNTVIGLRFSKLLRPETVTTQSLVLRGPNGNVPSLVVPAENGRLAFLTPKSALLPETKYTISPGNITDDQRLTLVPKSISFTTARSSARDTNQDTPNSDANAQSLAPLKAPPGVTAVAGQALRLNGTPLRNVTLKIDQKSVRSDRTGRFLLTDMSAGHHALVIDGRTATVSGRTYGVFEAGIEAQQGQTLVLPYKIWMTELDVAHAVRVQFPTTQEVVITTPTLPGLELRLPPKTVVTDIDGKIATQISITPIPLSQPPFPLPAVQVPIYFTIQPGGGYIQVNSTDGPKGARLIYPNMFRQAVGTRMNFFNYDADTPKGWFVYGQGSVSPDQKSIVPDPGVVLYELTGAMVAGNGGGPGRGPGGGPPGGDPVDLATGLFVYEKTDLYLPDTMPIALTRTYRQGDTASRAFGIATTHPYDMFIAGDLNDFSYVYLVLPNGGRIRFDRIAGNSWNTSTLQCITNPGSFYGAIFSNGTPGGAGGPWIITLKDGTVLKFLQPGLFGAFKNQDVGLLSITDRNGNTLQVVRDANNYISRIVSPNGRWVQLTYDGSFRITQAQDNIGRIVQYSYDPLGRLTQVTDANNGVWTYGWDPTNIDQMTSITDARNIQYLQNEYDSNGRVRKQTLGGTSPAIYLFNYAVDGSNDVTQTTVTDPNGNTRRVSFAPQPASADGYFHAAPNASSDTRAVGKPEQQTTRTVTDPSTNLVTSVTDSLNGQTSFTYDSRGAVLSATQLAGTPDAVTTSVAYEPSFSQPISSTDGLGHTTSFSHDVHGNLTSVTDAAGNMAKYSYDSQGRLVSKTDPAGNTWNFAYSGADLSSITDQFGNTEQMLSDGAGRSIARTDPSGQTTYYQYNALNQVTHVTDALGGLTSLQYDTNGNLLSVTDSRNAPHSTTYSYDNMNGLQARTDPLGNSESFGYDNNENLTCLTDGRGKVTVFQYDGFNRKVFTGFGASTCAGGTYESTISYSYDGRGRLTSVTDSIVGTITRVYDALDQLLSETTPQGSVSYQYDADGRIVATAVAGQTPIAYVYDSADKLTQITQGTSTVSFGYDANGRRTSLTLPNGIGAVYGYDGDSRLTSLTYQNGTNQLGNLTYSYDQAGRVARVGGTFARTGLPSAVSSASYDIANRLSAWMSNSAFTYDGNGNLTSDGANTYFWDARNQLSSISGGVTAAFQYDPFGRRISKTIAGATTGFLYDGSNVAQELTGGSPSANILSGGLDEVFMRTDANVRTFLAGGVGSTIALTDPTGAVATQYTYEPFGNTSSSGSASNNTVQFTGRENDGSGLYFYRARYYAPNIGRFISADPQEDGPNVYAYVGNSPLTFIDPAGLVQLDYQANYKHVGFWDVFWVAHAGDTARHYKWIAKCSQTPCRQWKANLHLSITFDVYYTSDSSLKHENGHVNLAKEFFNKNKAHYEALEHTFSSEAECHDYARNQLEGAVRSQLKADDVQLESEQKKYDGFWGWLFD